MGKVLTHMTMSLDGYIAEPDDQIGELFDWYEAGEVSVPSSNENMTFEVDEASAEMLRELTENAGALVSGRRLFDIADGWDDNHPVGAPVVVVTHSAPRMPPSGGRGRRSSTESRRRSPRRGRSPATRTSRSPAPTSSSRRSTSAWWTRCASASCRCCSARASRTSRSWTRPPAARGPGRGAGTPRPAPQVPGPSLTSRVGGDVARTAFGAVAWGGRVLSPDTA